MLYATKRIEQLWKNQQFGIFLIYSPSGIGKSVYAWKILRELYPELAEIQPIKPDPVLDNKEPIWTDTGCKYKDVRKFLVFKPTEMLHFSEYMRRIQKSDPSKRTYRFKAILSDDAGIWLNSENWKDPYVAAVTKWLQVARTITSSIILTTTSPFNIVKKIRNLDMYTIRIMPDSKNARIAKGYKQSVFSTGKSFVKGVWLDRFNVMLDNDLYNWYAPVRQSYVDEINQELRDVLVGGVSKSDVLAGRKYGV